MFTQMLVDMIERLILDARSKASDKNLLHDSQDDAARSRTMVCQLPRKCGKTEAIMRVSLKYNAVLVVANDKTKSSINSRFGIYYNLFTMAEFRSENFKLPENTTVMMFDDISDLMIARERYSEDRNIAFVSLWSL